MNPILTRLSLALFTALVLAPTGARAEPPAATRPSAPARPPAADKPFVGRLEYRSVAKGGEGRVVLAFAPEGARVEFELRAAGLTRVALMLGAGDVPQAELLKACELIGAKVLPRVAEPRVVAEDLLA